MQIGLNFDTYQPVRHRSGASRLDDVSFGSWPADPRPSANVLEVAGCYDPNDQLSVTVTPTSLRDAWVAGGRCRTGRQVQRDEEVSQYLPLDCGGRL